MNEAAHRRPPLDLPPTLLRTDSTTFCEPTSVEIDDREGDTTACGQRLGRVRLPPNETVAPLRLAAGVPFRRGVRAQTMICAVATIPTSSNACSIASSCPAVKPNSFAVARTAARPSTKVAPGLSRKSEW